MKMKLMMIYYQLSKRSKPKLMLMIKLLKM